MYGAGSACGLEPPFIAWSRSRPNSVGVGVDPGPRTSGAGAAQKSGASATLLSRTKAATGMYYRHRGYSEMKTENRPLYRYNQ